MFKKDTCCSYCGTPFVVTDRWPRDCAACENITWSNPLPVAVIAVPTNINGSIGVFLIRRGTDPGKGKLALPSGFIETGESWQAAAVRELKEETGLVIGLDELSHLGVISVQGKILIAARTGLKPVEFFDGFKATYEATECYIVTMREFDRQDLSFPNSHGDLIFDALQADYSV